MENNDAAKRLIELTDIIRPALPRQADYTAEYKASLYDRARALLCDERRQQRAA
jgi:hypothetical protein